MQSSYAVRKASRYDVPEIVELWYEHSLRIQYFRFGGMINSCGDVDVGSKNI